MRLSFFASKVTGWVQIAYRQEGASDFFDFIVRG